VGIKSPAPGSAGALDGVIASRLDDAGLAQLRLAGIGSDAEALRAIHLAGPAALARYAAGAPVNTDDRASLEYRIADHVLGGTGDDARVIASGLDDAR
jgi:hypothetical protein